MKPFAQNAQTPQQRIADAINASDPAYVLKTLETRTNGRAGSYVPDVTAAELLDIIKQADWKPFNHTAIAKEATAFRADIPGLLGVLPVTSLPPGTEIIMADPKGTGFYSAHVNENAVANIAREKTSYSTLILGPENGREVFYTFHPGDPVVPQGIDTKGAPAKTVTAGDLARAYPGLSVKITAPETYALLTAKAPDSSPKKP